MGSRGPKPTPTAILAARGSPRANRRSGEPVPDFTPPPCPDWLDDTAKAMWAELCPQLCEMRVMGRTDANALARYCRLWSRWRKAEAVLEAEGDTIEAVSKTGATYVTARPEVAIASTLAALLAKLEADFGLTPAARTRVNVGPEPKPADDSKSRFFNKPPELKIAK